MKKHSGLLSILFSTIVLLILQPSIFNMLDNTVLNRMLFVLFVDAVLVVLVWMVIGVVFFPEFTLSPYQNITLPLESVQVDYASVALPGLRMMQESYEKELFHADLTLGNINTSSNYYHIGMMRYGHKSYFDMGFTTNHTVRIRNRSIIELAKIEAELVSRGEEISPI